MADIAVGIKDILEEAGIGVFGAATGWNISIGQRPQEPATSVTIYKSGGNAPWAAYLLDFPSVQVTVRGNPGGYVEAEAKAQAVKDALHSLPSQDRNGDRWQSILQVGEIAQIGFDDNNRPLFSLNYDLRIEPAQSGNENRVPLPL